MDRRKFLAASAGLVAGSAIPECDLAAVPECVQGVAPPWDCDCLHDTEPPTSITVTISYYPPDSGPCLCQEIQTISYEEYCRLLLEEMARSLNIPASLMDASRFGDA